MTDGNDVFDRNLERLIRAAAGPPPRAEGARREFLARVEGKAPSHVRVGRMIAMAASLLAAAAFLYSALAPRVPVQTPAPGNSKETVTAPAPARNEGAPGPVVAPAKDSKREAVAAAPPAAMTAKDDVMTLTCTLPPPRAANPELRFEGTAPFPDRTMLVVSVVRVREVYAGGRLAPAGESAGGGNPEVHAKRFGISPRWDGPGRYVVTVNLHESQRPELAEALKKIPLRTFTFEFDGWGGELAVQLGPKLQDFDALLLDCQDLLARIEKLAAKESTWIKERRNVDPRGADIVLTKEAEELVKEAGRMKTRLEQSPVKSLYPAAHGELLFTIQGLHGNAQRFDYQAGKFAGAGSYHATAEKLKTHRGETFTFESLKKYLGEADAFAGRECALWMVKDLRRGAAPGSFADLLKIQGAHAGIAPLVERLSKAAPGDLDGLEAEIRSGK